MKKIIFIGSSGCGKTTLAQKLRGEEIIYKKTQEASYRCDVIDTPGEYIQTSGYYGILNELALKVDVVALFANAKEQRQVFPPLFTNFFTKQCIGIVTKIDVSNSEKILYNKKQLALAGCKKIFLVSTLSGIGVDTLLAFLKR